MLSRTIPAARLQVVRVVPRLNTPTRITCLGQRNVQLNARTLNILSGAKKQSRRNKTVLRTLDPSKLIAEDFMDLSNVKQKTVWTPTTFDGHTLSSYKAIWLTHCLSANAALIQRPFPSGTSGFLYLHRVLGAPEASAEVRFRITQNPDPESFSSGRDLFSFGVPWSLPLMRQQASRFDPLLARDGLVLTDVAQLRDRSRFAYRSVAVVYAFKQPFILEGGCSHIQIIRHKGDVSDLTSIQLDSNVCLLPMSHRGPFVARFERVSKGSEDSACLRVAKIDPRLFTETSFNEDVRPLLDTSEGLLMIRPQDGKPWACSPHGPYMRKLQLLMDLPDDTVW